MHTTRGRLGTAMLQRPSACPPCAGRRYLAARGTNGEAVGRFSAERVSDASGFTVMRYTPCSTSSRGPVTITATPLGSSVRGTTVLEVLPP